MSEEENSSSTGSQFHGATTDEIFVKLYSELRRLAAYKLGQERSSHTLQATALVNEAYLRLGKSAGEFRWENKRQFFSRASEVMRRILVDHARRKESLKRGGDLHRTQLDESSLTLHAPSEELLAVDEALERFAEIDPSSADLVKLRYFVGLTMEEAVAALDISSRTAHRQWARARDWLYKEMKKDLA